MSEQQENFDECLCSITLKVMRDPVNCPRGFSYERSAIEKWIDQNHTYPLPPHDTLEKSELVPNIKRNGDYRRILQKAKEYLIIGDLSSAYEIVNESELDMTLLNDWSLKVEELKNVKIKIIELENLIFKKLGKDFD